MAKSKAISNIPLVKIEGLKKHFPLKKTSMFQREILSVKANDGIDLVIHKGETLGLVGESGCGKSTLGRVLLQLYPLTAGKAMYYGKTLEEYAPRYLYRDIRTLKTSKDKYNRLEAQLPVLEEKIKQIQEDPNNAEKRKEFSKLIQQLRDENEQIVERSKADVGAFIVSNNAKLIARFLKFDETILENEVKTTKLKEKMKVLQEQLAAAKNTKNEKAEAEVKELQARIKGADLNLVAELTKKLALAERKTKAHVIAIDVKIRNLQKEINITRTESKQLAGQIKATLDKNVDLNTDVIQKLLQYKNAHTVNAKKIQEMVEYVDVTQIRNRIVKSEIKMQKIIRRVSGASGAFILANNVEEVSDVLFENIRNTQLYVDLQQERVRLDVARHRTEEKLKQKQDEYTEFQKDVANERITKLKAQIAEVDKKMAASKEIRETTKQQLRRFKDRINDHPKFDELEANREKGLDLTRLAKSEMRRLRQDLQIIFQDPYSSLNPRMTVGQIIGEGLKAHKLDDYSYAGYQTDILNVMEKCGLAPYMVHRYPHQFSGGQRQRIGIARALAVGPKFVVCDEAVSALDVSIQSQIINLLEDLRDQENLTYLFISHDLSVIKHISDRIGVMYLGNIVELGDSEEIYKKPLHPYTKALISAIPTTDLIQKKRILLEGDIPSNVFPPSGCKFRTRCPIVKKECARKVPEFREVEPGRFVACHYYEETQNIRPN